jgi:hypothetical protein
LTAPDVEQSDRQMMTQGSRLLHHQSVGRSLRKAAPIVPQVRRNTRRMQMKKLILALAAVASLSVVAVPAKAQFGNGAYGGYDGGPVYGGHEGYGYPGYNGYGNYGYGLYGGGAFGRTDPEYLDHSDWRSRRYWRRSYYRRDGYYPN